MSDRIKARTRHLRFADITRHALLIVAAAVVLAPMFYMLLGSFKTKLEYINNPVGWPKSFVPVNYLTLFKDGQMIIWFKNSLIVTAASVTLAITVASLAAYSFARIRFVGKEKLFNFIISLMVIPPIVMLIPLFVLGIKAGLVNSYWSAILIYVGLMMPFNIYMLRNFFITIPESIIDSARIDGCGDLRIFLSIMVPLSRAAMMTLAVVSILWVWNELLIALVFLQKHSLNTLMVGLIQFQGKFRVNQPVILAGVLISIIPMIAFYLAGQRFFVRGLTAGAVKGE